MQTSESRRHKGDPYFLLTNIESAFMMDIWLGVVVAIIIVLIYYAWSTRREKFLSARRFMTGFWCASPLDCDTKGYRSAYLYMGLPINDVGVSRAYIVALKGGRGSINRPFDFDVQQAFTGGPICGKMCFDGQVCDVAIDLDPLLGRMVWRDTYGTPLFTWEKNARVTANLFDNQSRVGDPME